MHTLLSDPVSDNGFAQRAVAELRALAIERCRESGAATSWIQSTPKAGLIRYLANGQFSVPDSGLPPFKRHADTVIICAANTYGRGADRQYVGRNQLDAATLDRFAFSTVFIDFDRGLERAIVRGYLGDAPAGDELLSWAESVRDAIAKHRIRQILSTRGIASAAAAARRRRRDAGRAAGELLAELER